MNIIITMKCKSCGNEFSFPSNSGRRLHCSDICRKKYSYRPKYQRVCVICGEGFITKSFVRKSCSDECLHRLRSMETSARHNKVEVKANEKKRRKRAGDNERKNISDKYVKLILYKETGIRMKDIVDSNIVALKRQQLRLHREIIKCKGGMENVVD